MRKILTLSLILFFLSGIISCNSDDEPGTPPEIPNVDTFLMDFSDFQNGNGSNRVVANTNWTVAALKVGIWNILIGVTFVVPVTAFKATVDTTPTFEKGSDAWVWTNDFQFVGRTWTSRLLGKVVGESIEWEMYISQEGGFQDYLWYTGISSIDGSGGEWLLYKSPEDPSSFLKIEWEKSGDEVGSIKYLNVSNTAAEGSYIEFGRVDSGDYDSIYNINNTEAENFIEILWDREQKIGRIKDPLHFGDDVFHCWNASFEDADCE